MPKVGATGVAAGPQLQTPTVSMQDQWIFFWWGSQAHAHHVFFIHVSHFTLVFASEHIFARSMQHRA